jgi:hypothetical protein
MRLILIGNITVRVQGAQVQISLQGTTRQWVYGWVADGTGQRVVDDRYRPPRVRRRVTEPRIFYGLSSDVHPYRPASLVVVSGKVHHNRALVCT